MAKKIDVKNKVLEQGVHYLESPFGKREFPKDVWTQHNGDDLIGKNKGADYIVSIDNGIVKEVSYSSSRGYYVGILMDNGYLTRYLHLKKGSITVKVGQKVAKGQRIAYMGNTGYYKDKKGKKHQVSTHLHFAVVNDTGSFVDPMPYLMGDKDFKNTWEVGNYRVLYDKYLRTSPVVKATNKVIWKSLIPEWKKLTYANKVGKARFIVGKEREIVEFAYDTKGNLWGRCKTNKTPIWICVRDSSGNQVKKV